MPTSTIKQTPLYSIQDEQGAKFVPFAGFKMPVWYSNLKEEHMAVRENVGLFDISHMGVIKIEGENLVEYMQKMTCNDMTRCEAQKMVYSMVLNEEGFILDDVMAGLIDGVFYMVVNASNKAKISQWLIDHCPTKITITDLEPTHGFIAVQGPNATDKLAELFGEDLKEIKRFGVFEYELLGAPVIGMRTGYTGEDGFEFVIPNDTIQKVWKTLTDAGVKPCGLGARDTLRLEIGLPLYGQELSETITPLMTRYQWVLKWGTGFIGEEALAAQKETQELCTVGLEINDDKLIPRPKQDVKEGGYLTSGTLSPSLNKGIAMALVPIQYKELGTELTVIIRGKDVKATVVEVPFK